MTKKSPQIVHESEAQRQHVRVQIPAMVFLNGKEHAVKDLSNGGVQVLDVAEKYKVNQILALTLSLPFDGFSMSVDLKTEVEHYDAQNKVLGCKFVELSEEQISVLNNVLKSYISGHVVSEGDIISVVSRNNFMAVRKKTVSAPSLSRQDMIKRAIPMAVILSVGLIVFGLLVGNIIEKLSVVKSYQGVVQAESMGVRAHVDGLFKSLVSETNRTVSAGDAIGEIHTRVFVPGATKEAFITHVETIQSPCDCTVVHQHVQNGVFRSMGEPLFKMMSTNADPWVMVTLPSKDAYRINIHDDVKLHIGGDALTIEGIVVDMDTKGSDAPLSIIKVQPIESLDTDVVGRPVYAEFFVY
jgi:alginate biosynthesis protein Alg44